MQIGHQLHPQFHHFAALRLDLLPARIELAGVVGLGVDLHPWRIPDIPSVDQRHRRQNDALQTPDQFVARIGVADLGRPQQTAEADLGDALDELGVIVEIAIKHVGVRRGQRVSRPDQPVRAHPAALVNAVDRVGVAQSEQAVHLFSVGARREFTQLGKRPTARKIRVVAFVELVAADAQGHVLAVMEIGEGLTRLGLKKIWREAAPDGEIAAMTFELRIERRGGMREGVFPQVDVVLAFAERAHHLARVRKFVAPHETAGVGVSLPARLEPQHITRHAMRAQVPAHLQDFLLVETPVAAVPHAQPPARRHHSAAGEKVVALHGLAQRRTAEDVYIDPAGLGDFHEHFALLAHAPVAIRGWQKVARRRGRIGGTGAGCGLADMPCAAAIDGDVACGVDQHAIPARGDVKRHRRMGVAGIDARIGVHPQFLLQTSLYERLQLQPQPVDDLARLQRQSHPVAAVGCAALRAHRARSHRGQLGDGVRVRRVLAGGNRRDPLGRAKREPPDGRAHCV